MLKNHSVDEYIIGANRLFEYSSNKKFSIKEDNISYENIGSVAIEINNKIRTNYNIDIFKEEIESKIEKFQIILSELLSNRVRSLVKRNVNDEAELIINSKNFDKDIFKKFKISITKIFEKNVSKHLNINSNYLLNICSNPDFVSCVFPIESYEDYIITHIVGSNTNKKVVLAHLNRLSSTSLESLKVASLFVFRYELIKHLYNNPIRLFLWALDIYGIDISFSNETRRFFRKAILPTISPDHRPELNLRSYITGLKKNEIYYTSYYAKPLVLGLGISYELLYGVNLTKFLDDFKTGKV